MVATFDKIAKSAIESSSPANHSEFSRNALSWFSRTFTASRRSWEIFLAPARRTGRCNENSELRTFALFELTHGEVPDDWKAVGCVEVQPGVHQRSFLEVGRIELRLRRASQVADDCARLGQGEVVVMVHWHLMQRVDLQILRSVLFTLVRVDVLDLDLQAEISYCQPAIAR